MAGRWFSPGTPVSSNDKIDRHYITGILLKVALNTLTVTLDYFIFNIPLLFQYKLKKGQSIMDNLEAWSTLGTPSSPVLIYVFS